MLKKHSPTGLRISNLQVQGLKDFGWLAGSSGITQVMGVISMILMARVFTPEELGEYFFIQGWMIACRTLEARTLPGSRNH